MSSPPVTIRPTRPLAQAAAMMLQHRMDVSAGEVVVRGEVQAYAIRTFASRVPGVVAVESYLAWPN
jgi:CBS domain-containing protein